MKVSSPAQLARRLGLKMTKPEALTIRRETAGEGWSYRNARGRVIKDPRIVARLQKLAVPPAYQEVRYAADPRAHLQAIGRDAAGRLQYRYHPQWEKVREIQKAQRLIGLAEVLPRIRRALSLRLNSETLSREFALAALIELTSQAAIRAGHEEYAREHRTRGAATLLKSNVRCEGETVTLSFRAKGGKAVRKELRDAKLAAAIERLCSIPGMRLFQYVSDDGSVRSVRASDANAFLKELAGCIISLKDFRTLCGTAEVMEALALLEPGASARARKKQVLEAVRSAAAKLANTPAICRKSYVHPAVLTAFEAGALKEFADALSRARSAAPVVQAVGAVLESAIAAA